MKLLDPFKAILLGVALVGGFVIAIIGEVTGGDGLTVGVGIVMGVVGYLTGNGRLSRRGRTPVPTVGKSDPDAGD